MKIKSIIYTLLMVMSSLLFVTCSEEDILSQNGNNIDDNKVHLRIGLTLPEINYVNGAEVMVVTE